MAIYPEPWEGRLASAEWIIAVDEKPDAAAMAVQATKGLVKMVNKGAHICVKDWVYVVPDPKPRTAPEAPARRYKWFKNTQRS